MSRLHVNDAGFLCEEGADTGQDTAAGMLYDEHPRAEEPEESKWLIALAVVVAVSVGAFLLRCLFGVTK